MSGQRHGHFTAEQLAQRRVERNHRLVPEFVRVMEAGEVIPEPIMAHGRATPLLGYVIRQEIEGLNDTQASPQEFITPDGSFLRGPVTEGEASFVPGDITAHDLGARLGEAVAYYLGQSGENEDS